MLRAISRLCDRFEFRQLARPTHTIMGAESILIGGSGCSVLLVIVVNGVNWRMFDSYK